MLSKYRQALFLIAGIVYVYSVCPLLCATLEQKLCYSTSQNVEIRGNCCGGASAVGTEGSKTPAENQELCCIAKFEFVHQDSSPVPHKCLQIAVGKVSEYDSLDLHTMPVNAYHLPLSPHLFPAPFNHTISQRAPPYTRS